MISDTEQLRDFASRLRQAPWVGLDTEADSLHAYPEKLCLLQVAIPEEAAHQEQLPLVFLFYTRARFCIRERVGHH